MKYNKKQIKKFQQALLKFEQECGMSLDVQHDNNNQIIIYTNVFENKRPKSTGYTYTDQPKA